YLSFVEAVLAAECDFWQLSRNLFIVNGWNREANAATSTFYHLHMVVVGTERRCHCLCPEGRQNNQCIHVRFLLDHGDEKFPIDHRMTGKIWEENKTFLFSRNVECYEPLTIHNVFSVPSPGVLESIKNRAVVEHFGDDTGSGVWRCSKDPNIRNCRHILFARDSLQQHVQMDHLATDTNTERNLILYHDMPAVSSRQIPPPHWARIRQDGQLPAIPAFNQPPEVIPLGTASSCPCNSDSRSSYDPMVPTETRRCEVYGLTRMWACQIEVQKCSLCRRRFIGPDCQELGLFNWNNRVLLSHDLLDDYTSSFSASETPFVAWVAVLTRRYDTYQSPSPFLSEKRFRVIWFAYAALLALENDMRCSKCGPTPNITIWDGVTLAFNRKNLKASLSPPTTIHPNSKIRDGARHPTRPQCFDAPLRKLIRYVLTGPPLRWINNEESMADLFTVDDDPSDDDSEEVAISKKATRVAAARQKAFKDMHARLERIEFVVNQLMEIDTSIGCLFERCYGRNALAKGKAIAHAYTSLFMQMAADESVLQLTTRSVIESLKRFVEKPSFLTASHLNMFPALYSVVMLELSVNHQETVTDETLGLCRWVMIRGMTVLMSSITHEGGEKDAQELESARKWQKTGSCYSMPKIRHRPQYPLIHRDGMTDVGGQAKRGDGCGKYYSEYGQKRLTGGIMVVWCTHTVCYGFHCIPASEGRNEVFSAIYTHWEQAPEIVVYDYACNLAPYAMAREPTFFARSKFLIDHFHSMGHNSCGNACKLMTYVATNPDLDKINSSAAECGNSGILRIRKSVSYMTQDHAIIYTKTFLSIRNRLIIR
ncbi:hypothetical protein GALMADRAFT_50349, partial [Galerina marginata CBS 339.88]